MVEDIGFQSLIALAFPTYELPGRKYFTSLIDRKFSEARNQLMSIIKQADYIALTCDTWTSKNNESFITITSHFILRNELDSYVLDTKSTGSASHTSANLKLVLNATIDRWDIRNKLQAIVTDNASNITNAIELLDTSNIRCAAHTLQLSIRECLNEDAIEKLLGKCRSIVVFFKSSNKSWAQLQKMQAQLNLPAHKLIQDVATRWNSTYYMIERLYEQRSALTTFFCDVEELTNSEWNVIDTLINILQPAEAVTTALSGDQYCTTSMVIPQVACMLVQLRSIIVNDITLKCIKKKLVNSIESRFSDIETNILYTNSTILDPRLKDTCFISEANKEFAISKLRNELSQLSSNESVNDTQVLSQEPSSKRPKMDYWSFVKQQSANKPTVATGIDFELNKYLNETLASSTTDTLKWWADNKTFYPTLFRLVPKYLCAPATSCSSERVFSKAGEILSKKRNRLSSKHLDTLIFLNQFTKNQQKKALNKSTFLPIVNID